MNRTTITASLILAAALPFATASAAETEPTRHVYVSRADLGEPAAAAALHRRLAHAAREVCANAGGPNAAGQARIEACYDRALSDALRQLEVARTYAAAGRPLPAGG